MRSWFRAAHRCSIPARPGQWDRVMTERLGSRGHLLRKQRLNCCPGAWHVHPYDLSKVGLTSPTLTNRSRTQPPLPNLERVRHSNRKVPSTKDGMQVQGHFTCTCPDCVKAFRSARKPTSPGAPLEECSGLAPPEGLKCVCMPLAGPGDRPHPKSTQH